MMQGLKNKKYNGNNILVIHLCKPKEIELVKCQFYSTDC